MSKSVLIGALAACVLAVGLIAALTATVIVDDSGGGARVLRVEGSFRAPGPGPGSPGPGPGRGPGFRAPWRVPALPGLQKLKGCLERQAPGLNRARLRACLGLPALR